MMSTEQKVQLSVIISMQSFVPWDYTKVLKNAHKSDGITQHQLADKIDTKCEYVAMFKRSKTDMQISIHYDFKGCRFKILLNIRWL